MSLTITSDNDGQYVVSGVTSDADVTAPLGRKHFQVGAHLVGFDDNFAEPVIVRAYYDPTQDSYATLAKIRDEIDYIGYMQVMRLSFRGDSIPPEVYGGRLADRTPYVYGRDKRFVDFMGPSDASIRDIITPLYPYNAALVENVSTTADFCQHPRVNGSLWSPQSPGSSPSTVASLVAEISPGLLTPEGVTRALAGQDEILVLSPSDSALAHAEPYQLALRSLATVPLASAPDDGPPLAELAASQLAGQVIGQYVLLTLPDPEGLGATLVISTRPRTGGTDVVVHLLTDYDMAGLLYDAAHDALWRIREYLLVAGRTSVGSGPAFGRGRSGLNTPPFLFKPDEFALELKYWTVAIAVRVTRGAAEHRILSGFTWSAMFRYDSDTGQMVFSAIRQPRLIAEGFSAINQGISHFQRVLKGRNAARQSIDTSNFTRAAMIRDNLAAGTKVDFIVNTDTD